MRKFSTITGKENHVSRETSKIFSLNGQRAGISLICLAQACQPGKGDALALVRTRWRWARFLSDKKSGKESPKEGPSPSLWNPPRDTGCTCVPPSSALGPMRSHRWCRHSMGSTCFSGGSYFYRQGLTQVCSCSQLPGAWPATAGNSRFSRRGPGVENTQP